MPGGHRRGRSAALVSARVSLRQETALYEKTVFPLVSVLKLGFSRGIEKNKIFAFVNYNVSLFREAENLLCKVSHFLIFFGGWK